MTRLLVLFVALAGCGSQTIDAVDTLAARTGGGVVVTGDHSYYDGLAEHEHTYLTRVELDGDGNERARDGLGEVPAAPQPTAKPDGPRFADGTRLTIDPRSYDSAGPLLAHRLDAGGAELWQVELPIEVFADFSADGDGALILGGAPLQPPNDFIRGATVFKLDADGRVVWKKLLR